MYFLCNSKTETTMNFKMTSTRPALVAKPVLIQSMRIPTHAIHTHVCKHTTKIIYTDDSEEEDDDYCIGCETGADSISAHTDACNRANGFA